jgi:hypothetical protein
MIEEKEIVDETSCKSGVKFNSALRVVLIPSRGEYKSAGLCPELWWTSSDYFMFQQSAHSEIRLLSAYENINLNAARKKLYQPNENEAIEDSGSIAESVNDSVKLTNKKISENSFSNNKSKDDDNVLENDLVATEKTLSSPKPQSVSNSNNNNNNNSRQQD